MNIIYDDFVPIRLDRICTASMHPISELKKTVGDAAISVFVFNSPHFAVDANMHVTHSNNNI